MTYEEKLTDEIVSPEVKLRTGDGNGDYVWLAEQEYLESGVIEGLQDRGPKRCWVSFWWWVKVIFSCVSLLVLGVVLALWGGPLLIQKVIQHSLQNLIFDS